MRPLLALAPLLAGGCQAASPPRTDPAEQARPPGQPGELVIDLVDGTDLDTARQLTGLANLAWASPQSADESLAVAQVDDLGSAWDRLHELPEIEAVEPSLTYRALGLNDPNDPLWPRQWNLRKVGAPWGWRVGAGHGVTVAVIDTGIASVPDLAGVPLLEGASFVPDEPTPIDANGHGTHVAGTIAQATANGLGVAGIAPHARLLPLKALAASGSGHSEWVAAAIDEAVDNGAQVINLSLGGPDSRVIRVAVNKALAAGVVVVAAAGNTGRPGVSCPANIPGVIAVSATGPNDDLAPYSSTGPEVSLAAPGGDKSREGGGILQDTLAANGSGDHDFREFQGTSMAAPHVAGAAAVLLAAGAPDVRHLLFETARDLGKRGRDDAFGYGRVDLGAAIRHLLVFRNGLLFLAGGLLTWLLAAMGGLGRPRTLGLVGGCVAGGLFVLPLLPLPPGVALRLAPVIELVSRPLVEWPAALWNPALTRFTLLGIALLPVGATLVFGPTRTLGPLVAALSAGIAAYLFHAAWLGLPRPFLLPGAVGTGWLLVQGLICLLCAMACVGANRLRAGAEAAP